MATAKAGSPMNTMIKKPPMPSPSFPGRSPFIRVTISNHQYGHALNATTTQMTIRPAFSSRFRAAIGTMRANQPKPDTHRDNPISNITPPTAMITGLKTSSVPHAGGTSRSLAE